MYTVIIVDDNKNTANMLSRTIDWTGFGCRVASVVYNGTKGLEAIVACKPDIIIADINMPDLNGLDMVGFSKDIVPHAKIIFISAYDKFDYATKAIDLRASNYLLKPFSVADMGAALKKVVGELEATQALHNSIFPHTANQEPAIQAMDARMRHNLEKEAALTMALNNPLVPEATLIGLFHDMGITFSTYFVVLLTVENLYQGDTPAAFPSITNHLEGLNTIGIYFQNQVFVYFFLDTHPRTLPKDLVDKTVASLENHGMQITRISIGKLHASLLELRTALEELGDKHGYPTQLQEGVYDSWPLLVKDIIVYIDTHFAEQVTLETLSAKFKVSPAYIGSLVKKYTGRKYIDYLTDAKMDMARKLLMDPRYRVEEVANIVGYRNYVTFYKVFVKNTGKSPSNFRNTGFTRSP